MKMPEKVGTRYNEDKTSVRTGWILEENTTNNILKAVEDAKLYIGKQRTEEKKLSMIEDLLNILDVLKAGVMIGYPAYHGLPEWEPCVQILEDKADILDKDEAHFEVIGNYIQFYLNIFCKSKILLHVFNQKYNGSEQLF